MTGSELAAARHELEQIKQEMLDIEARVAAGEARMVVLSAEIDAVVALVAVVTAA